MDAQVQVRGREGSQAKLMRVRYPYRFCVRRRDLTRKMPWYTFVHTFPFLCLSHSRAGTHNTHALRPQHVFQTPVSSEVKKRRLQERISGSCLVGFSSLASLTYTTAESTKNKNPEQYHKYVEKTVESDYPVPCGCISKARRVDRDASKPMKKVFIHSTLLTVKWCVFCAIH